jgi:hypothetical protein
MKGRIAMDAILILSTLTLLRLIIPFGGLLLIGTLLERRNPHGVH